MYSGRQPLLVVEVDCERAVARAAVALNQAGFSILRSFDLNSAIAGRAGCNCQMVVLLVYAQEGSPATIIFDSRESFTDLYLVNNPSQSTQGGLIRLLQEIFPTPSTPIQGAPAS